MPPIQTTYDEKLDQGRAGQLANAELCNLISRTIEGAAGVGFGICVERGTHDKGCTVFDGGTPLGISVRERSVDANNPNGFKQYDTIRVITKGPIFADAPVAVTAGDPVYVLDADGTFHNAAAAGRTLYPGAVWDTTTTGAGLAVIALDIR